MESVALLLMEKRRRCSIKYFGQCIIYQNARACGTFGTEVSINHWCLSAAETIYVIEDLKNHEPLVIIQFIFKKLSNRHVKL